MQLSKKRKGIFFYTAPLIISVFLTVLHHRGFSQEIFLDNHTVENGLASNEIYEILEDHQGYLLIATDRGLVRYDGYAFHTVPFSNGETNNPIYYIYKSGLGNIYGSSAKGYIYEYKNGMLYPYRYNEKISSVYTHPGLLIANSISESQDSLWISYNNDRDYFVRIGSCVVSRDGVVQKIEKEDGIYFDLKNSFFYRQLNNKRKARNLSVHIDWKDSTYTSDTILLPPPGYIRRLYYLRINKFDCFSIGTRFLIYKNKKRVGAYSFAKSILVVKQINERLVYFGFEHGGAELYEINNTKIMRPIEKVLENVTVTAIHKDRQGGIWYGTFDQGVFYKNPSNIRFKRFKEPVRVIEKNNNKVIVAFSSGLVEEYSQGKVINSYHYPLSKHEQLAYLSFTNDQQEIPISTRGFYFRINGDRKLVLGTNLRIVGPKASNLYGADGLRSQLNIFTTYPAIVKTSISFPKRIISMLYDSKNCLWLGTLEGLYKYQNNRLTNLSDSNPIFKQRIVSIKELENGNIVIASLSNGIVTYSHGKYTPVYENNSLFMPVVNNLATEKNLIWLGTNKGLIKINPEKNKIDKYGRDLGLPTLNIHEFTVCEDWIYIKWKDKLIIINQQELIDRLDPSDIILTGIFVNGSPYLMHQKLFGYKENNVRFEFTATNLGGAKEQRYSYRLVGSNSHWQTTSNRSVEFNNLPPGHYVFETKAFTLGKNGYVITKYAFTINAPFWQKTWFIVLLLSILITTSYLIIRMRFISVKRKNKLLLDLSESKQKALVQLINPHFISNTLNSVQASIFKQDKLMAAATMAKFAKLMRLSMDLSKKKLVPLSKELELLNDYLVLESLRSPEKFTFHIELQNISDANSILVPSMLIQPFIENSLKHGIMHSHEKGNVLMRLRMEAPNLVCTIEDNGVGRVRSSLINANRSSQHSSSGMDITISRLQLLHQQQRSNFFYNISDGEDDRGTIVVFYLPYIHDV